MKKLIILFVVTGLVFSVSLLAEEKADKTKVDVKITLGAKVAGKDGSLVKAKEYDALDDGVGPMLKAKISGQAGNIFFNILSSVLGSFKQQAHDLSVDFNRILKQSFTFTSLYHRLDHDPLTNLDVVSHARSAVYVTDFDPTKQYHITRDEFESKTKLTIPQVPFMKLYVNFRNEHRVGEYQARTLSKCSACHVVAKSRSIDNFNRDIQLGSIVKVGSSNIDYSYTHNQFKESGATPTNHYLKVEHPD